MLAGNQVQVMACGAGVFENLFPGSIAVSTAATSLYGTLFTEILDEIVDQDRKILLIDLGSVRDHRRNKAFPSFFVQVQLDYSVQPMTRGTRSLKNFLSIPIGKRRILHSRE